MQMLERFGRITARDSQFPVNHPPHVISPATVRRSQAAGTIRDANWVCARHCAQRPRARVRARAITGSRAMRRRAQKMLGRLSRVQTNYPQREMLESARQHEEWRRARARFPSNKLPRGAAGSRAQTPSRVPPLGLGVPHTTDPYLQDLMTPYPSGTMSARHSSRPQSSARTLTANHMAPPSARSAVPGHGPVAARQAPSRMRPSSEGPQGRSRSQPRAVSASRPRASSVHSSDGMPFRATGRNASPLNARAFFGQPVAPNGAAHPASQRSVRYEGESARARASVEAEVDDDSAAHERSAGAPRPRSRFDDLPTLARGGPSAGAQPRQPPSWSAGARGGSAVGDAAGAGSGAWLAARSPAMAGSRAPLAPPSGVPLQSSPQATAALPDGMLEQASLDAAGARERAGGTGAVFHDVAANGMPLSAYDDVVASSGRQVDYAQAMPASASRPAPSIDAAPSQSRVAGALCVIACVCRCRVQLLTHASVVQSCPASTTTRQVTFAVSTAASRAFSSTRCIARAARSAAGSRRFCTRARR
jgi:hypothetical protein